MPFAVFSVCSHFVPFRGLVGCLSSLSGGPVRVDGCASCVPVCVCVLEERSFIFFFFASERLFAEHVRLARIGDMCKDFVIVCYPYL